MGLLTPLYLAGLAALSLPVVLHLIRRTPRGRQAFSSLMFLAPSPPRLTRRSRLDHLLLLVLRLTALALLACAFARPFLRETAVLPLDDLPGRRLAILLDTSASMRRGNLWQQAIEKVEQVLADLGPADDVSLIAFDDRRQTIVEFSDDGDSRAGKAALVRRRLRELKNPSWRGTQLGAALVALAGELDTQTDVRQSAAEPQLVVVSDFARGCTTEALQSYRWPANVPVALHALSSQAASNAGVQLLLDTDATANEPRVRVTNAADSAADQFFVNWQYGKARAAEASPLASYVPAGQSRVVRLPRPEAEASADRIVLRGDDADFDNVFYVVPPRRHELKVAWLGPDEAVSAESARYFFELAVADDALRQIDVRPAATLDQLRLGGAEKPAIVVVASPITQQLADALKVYIAEGGMVIVIATDELAESVGHLLDDVEPLEPATPDDKRSYRMLGEIDFTHPLFAALANPRYSDFTKIHFWHHQPLRLRQDAATRVLARFDNGDPAILERSMGQGRVLVFTSGWQPEESQLALSSKFVPLVQTIIDLAAGSEEQTPALTVGERLLLPKTPRKAATVEKPDGSRVVLASEAVSFSDTDLPGIYRLYLDGQEHPFAVNVAAAESNTAPMESETLEQLGVRVSSQLTRSERAEQVRQQRDTELESRQHLWRWLIAEAIVLLALETWLAGRAAAKLSVSS